MKKNRKRNKRVWHLVEKAVALTLVFISIWVGLGLKQWLAAQYFIMLAGVIELEDLMG